MRNHLEALAGRDYTRLKKALRCDDVCLRGLQKLITSLNPRPGREYAADDTRYVVPDVIVRKVKGTWIASLNPEAMPKLRVNRLYADILARARSSGSHQLASQLQEAKWLIKNVQQRFDTILRVAQAIVDRQRHFFEHGEVAMRPCARLPPPEPPGGDQRGSGAQQHDRPENRRGDAAAGERETLVRARGRGRAQAASGVWRRDDRRRPGIDDGARRGLRDGGNDEDPAPPVRGGGQAGLVAADLRCVRAGVSRAERVGGVPCRRSGWAPSPCQPTIRCRPRERRPSRIQAPMSRL